jgi:predicted DNA-binding protein (UPF0251 family)
MEKERIYLTEEELEYFDFTGVIYKTIKEASESLNISRSSIKYRLNSENEKFKNWFKIK